VAALLGLLVDLPEEDHVDAVDDNQDGDLIEDGDDGPQLRGDAGANQLPAGGVEGLEPVKRGEGGESGGSGG
jgi:hypothetical protein